MENAWMLDALRIYYECGFVTALIFVIISQGAIGIRDVLLLILFWPAPLLIMVFGLKGGDDK